MRRVFTLRLYPSPSVRQRSSLSDMEPTLIRNLSDHHGNNLAHVLAACGHVQALAWLVGTCGHVLSEALADENKHGLTPSVAAVRVSTYRNTHYLVAGAFTRVSVECWKLQLTCASISRYGYAVVTNQARQVGLNVRLWYPLQLGIRTLF